MIQISPLGPRATSAGPPPNIIDYHLDFLFSSRLSLATPFMDNVLVAFSDIAVACTLLEHVEMSTGE